MVTLRKQEAQSVQEFEPADSVGYNGIWFVGFDQTSILPAWGTHSRDRVLRNLYRDPYNWMGQAAVAAIIRKVKSTPWQIKAGRNTVSYFQDLLQQAQFTKGWGDFISRLLLDFLTCDYGAYIEIIGRGKPDSALKGRVMGLAALDSLRCVPTGNLEYPVVYYSRRTNKLHKLHYTRVCRLVDMPDGDESRHMAGLSSMARATAMIEQQIPLNKYISTTFDNLPPIGIFYNNANMDDEAWKKAWASYKAKLKSGAAGMLTINGGGQTEVKGEFLRFAAAPDGFDYDKYTEIAVNAYAAAFGIDRQDIYPLTGKQAGTATQSEILHEKSKGMAFGDILSTIERAINNFILPPAAEFSFEYQDEEKDLQVATRDNVLIDISAKMLAQGIPDKAVLRYLANMSETFRDVMTDENGEIIELPDDDRKPVAEAEINEAIVADDNTDDAPEDAAVGTDSKAIDLPREAYAYIPLGNNEQILQVMRLVKSKMPKDNVIEWQSAPTFHITLCFAKDVEDSEVDGIADAIRLPSDLWIDSRSLNVFETPDGYALHLEVELFPDMKQLQASVYGAFAGAADDISPFSIPADYKPHITLGYLKQNVGWQDLQGNVDIGIKMNPTQVIIARDDYDPVAILNANQSIKSYTVKAIQATRLDFENRYDDFLAEIRAGNLDRRRAGVILRGMLRTFGFRSYRDGLEDGGVDPNEFDDRDQGIANTILAEQSPYVSNFTDAIINGGGISDAVAKQKAAMWFNKSIKPFYDAGLKSAAANGMFEWVLGDTEHCKDCLRLSGQVHRLKSYLDKGWYPQSDALDCGGFNCECRLVRTTEKARGRF